MGGNARGRGGTGGKVWPKLEKLILLGKTGAVVPISLRKDRHPLFTHS